MCKVGGNVLQRLESEMVSGLFNPIELTSFTLLVMEDHILHHCLKSMRSFKWSKIPYKWRRSSDPSMENEAQNTGWSKSSPSVLQDYMNICWLRPESSSLSGPGYCCVEEAEQELYLYGRHSSVAQDLLPWKTGLAFWSLEISNRSY